MDWIDMLQWPAMVVTVGATWLVGSRSPARRKLGFWIFILSNVLWVIWGVYSDAYALVVLQFALAALNLRGMVKARKLESSGAPNRAVGAAERG